MLELNDLNKQGGIYQDFKRMLLKDIRVQSKYQTAIESGTFEGDFTDYIEDECGTLVIGDFLRDKEQSEEIAEFLR